MFSLDAFDLVAFSNEAKELVDLIADGQIGGAVNIVIGVILMLMATRSLWMNSKGRVIE